MGSLGTGELIILLFIAASIGVPIWAIIRAFKSGQTGWAVGILLAMIFGPLSLVLAIVYLLAIHPKQTASTDPIASGSAAPAGWLADPSGRHQLRYWDGATWTDQVSNDNVASTDPPASD